LSKKKKIFQAMHIAPPGGLHGKTFCEHPFRATWKYLAFDRSLIEQNYLFLSRNLMVKAK